MATTDKEKVDNTAGQELSNSTDGMQIRAKNRLKAATDNVKSMLKEAFKPAKKYIMIAGISIVLAFIIIILLTAALWYIKDMFTKQDTDNPKNVPGTTKNVMTATAQKNPDTGEITFLYNEKKPEANQLTNLGSSSANSTTTTSLDNFLFIGDSRYEGTDLYIKNLGNNIKNAGVSSSTIDEWVNVVKNKGKGTVQGKTVDITGTYSGISIQLGANGVYQNVDNTVNSMKTLITEIQSLYPNVPIFVNSCVQVNSKANSNGYSWNAKTFRDNVNDFNKAVQDYCNTIDNVYYIDVNTNLNDSDGFLKNEYTDDGLHCNNAGGQVFADNVKNAILNSSSTVGNTANNAQDSDFLIMTKSIVISKNDNGEYCIATDLDARVNEIYKTLKENGSGALTYFEDEEEAKEALKLWIMAEYSSQYVNLSENVENYKYDYNADYIQGSIKVKRYSVDNNGNEVGKFITYKTPQEFNQLKSKYRSNGDTTVFNHFTIDSEDNLVIAQYVREDQTSSWTGETDPNGDLDPIYTKYSITDKPLPYRNVAREYSMPFNLLWAMVVYGEDVSFSNEIAKLVIDSEMVIGIRDNVTTTKKTTVDKYLNEEKIKEYIYLGVSTLNLESSRQLGDTGNFYEYYIRPSGTKTTSKGVENDYSTNSDNTGVSGINESLFFEKTTVNTLIENSVAMDVEYIDGWFAKQEMKYEAVHTPGTDNSNTVPIANTEYEKVDYNEKETSNSDEADKIISSDVYAPDMYNKLREEIKSRDRYDILRNAMYNEIYSYLRILRFQSRLYYSIVWNEGKIVDDIINGTGNSYSHLTQESVDAISSGHDVEEVRAKCVSIHNTILGFYNSDKKEEILNENIRAIEAKIEKVKYTRTVDRTITTTTNVDTKKFNKIETKVTEKTAKKTENGETESFVSILCKEEHEKAYGGLTGSFSNWFFSAIAKNEDTEVYIDLIKYLLYKATGDDYGVTEYDMSTVKFKLNGSNMKDTGMIQGGTIQAKVWFALKNLGYSDEQVAGVMGNIHWESGGFTTTTVESNGVGIGLIQWSYGRRTQLEAYAASKGVDWKDEDTQIEFLIAEMTQGGGANGYANYQFCSNNGYTPNDWYNANTIEEATTAFCWTFERPGIPHVAERINWAKHYYDEFHGKTLVSFDNSDFLQLAIEIHDYIRINNFYYGNGSAIPIPAGQQYIDCSAYVSWVLYDYGYQELFQNNGNWQYIVSTFRDKQSYLESTYGWVYKDPSQAQPGDLLIYDNWEHIEIYAGGDDQYGAGSTDAIRRVNPNKGNYKNQAIKAITITKPK